jgi:beta-xylosidase
MLLLPGHNPDPTILRDGDDYYVVTSTFEYFPGLAIYHSADLTEWTLLGHALDRPSQLNMRTVESGGGVFAPSLRKAKGRYYIACTAMYRVPNMTNFHKASGHTLGDIDPRASSAREGSTSGPMISVAPGATRSTSTRSVSTRM